MHDDHLVTDPFGVIQQSHRFAQTVHTEVEIVNLKLGQGMKALCQELCVLVTQPVVD